MDSCIYLKICFSGLIVFFIPNVRPADQFSSVVNGTWGEWSTWSPCSSSCGEAERVRNRLCYPPPFEHSSRGKKLVCPGGDAASNEIENCNVPECEVDGSWGKWSDFSECSVTCGKGKRIRRRHCDNPVPSFGGKPCEGPAVEEIDCERGIKCPVHGGWSEWSQWSRCSASCGEGVQQRIRKCTNPAPQHQGLPCEGSDFDEKVCHAPIKCPVHGRWSPWSKWGPCIRPDCNSGSIPVRFKYRTCSNPYPKYSGKMCQGPFYRKGYCVGTMPVNCPVDGSWGSWSPWNCTCEYAYRERFCDSPKPLNGGKPCVGEGFEILQAQDEHESEATYEKLCSKQRKKLQCDDEDEEGMPFKCCVTGCRGNYDAGSKCHVFSFPNDEKLKLQWQKAIPRKDFTYTKNSKDYDDAAAENNNAPDDDEGNEEYDYKD